MDGNRRWAKAQGFSASKGHYYGYLKVLEVIDWAIKEKIEFLSLYAFSTENWQRKSTEVHYLMKLAKMIFKKHRGEFQKKGVKILISGVKDGLDKEVLEAIADLQKATNSNKKIIVNICFNYGGRREIIEGIKKIIRKKISIDKINENDFRQYLFHNLPDPDMIVRTSGEQRLSNFLTWQSVYSELLFIKKHWPAFTHQDLKNIIKVFNQRQRRFGRG